MSIMLLLCHSLVLHQFYSTFFSAPRFSGGTLCFLWSKQSLTVIEYLKYHAHLGNSVQECDATTDDQPF